ncbi:GH116 family glycosyl-hydrolase [Microbacterium gorillae]|uniref:GH116 family glycosyl-hydrolase n=1 Tax=Microbacterium gorillae TaxID=1231063 RepID=UPI00069499F9|nr:GH116 family glycosyl-hydrolase [Microbacterium gorillae]
MIRGDGARVLASTASRAAFPLGGIGTGNVSLGARGELRDWELENHPDKGRINPYSFFAIHADAGDGRAVSRVLEAVLNGPHDLDAGYPFERVAGLPRLDGATLTGTYPTARVDFTDAALPVAVRLTAFTPLVPLDEDASGMPVAVLRYTVTNPGPEPVSVTIAGSLSHPGGRGDGPWGMRATQNVRWREEGAVRGLAFDTDLPEGDLGAGTVSLTTTDDAVTVKPQWVVGFWPDGSRLFWNDFSADGLLDAESEATLVDRPAGLFADSAADGEMSEAEVLARLPRLRTGSLGIRHEIAPGAEQDFEFVLAWCFPNRQRAWSGNIFPEEAHRDEIVRNQYATRWPDAWSAAMALHGDLAALEAATLAFRDALYSGGLPGVLADSIGANIAAARSTTCFRLEDGTPGGQFAAWEGSFDHVGSCEGTCTHVWSYAQTIAWLWPGLERSARRNEFLRETDEDGAQKFRTAAVFGDRPWFMGPAVDGQLGTVIRLHREWRFSGDAAFLGELYPAAARCLRYAATRWDRDGDGLLDGELHNTYDIEFHGIEPLANGLYVTAMLAGADLADAVGDVASASDWRARAGAASRLMDERLFDGRRYVQRIDDVDAERYQYGTGVLSDQLLGQFHAYLNGLGPVVDPAHIRSALAEIVEHNLREDVSSVASTQRVFAVRGEGGLLLASWPNGGRPRIPFVYADEVWTGVEHQVAATALFAGMPEAALAIEERARARYDGVVRNPWNEIECGNHYARSLSSWGLLIAATGAQWDAAAETLHFAPAGDVRAPFTTAHAWGTVGVDGDEVRLDVHGGRLRLRELTLRGVPVATDLVIEAGASAVCGTAQPSQKEET